MIIECHNCKSTFDIPFVETLENGRKIKCGLCDKEWVYKSNLDPKDMNPLQKTFVSKEIKINKKKNSFTFFLQFSFFIFILLIGIYSNQAFILNKFPFFFGFFEASEILKEIISQNFNWLIETIRNLIE